MMMIFSLFSEKKKKKKKKKNVPDEASTRPRRRRHRSQHPYDPAHNGALADTSALTCAHTAVSASQCAQSVGPQVKNVVGKNVVKSVWLAELAS